MNEKTRINKRIDQYLSDVRKQLEGLNPDEVRSIVDDLRTQIETSLYDQGEESSLAKINAILAEMDSPESFVPEIDGETIVDPKVSKKAIYGAILLPFGLLLAFFSLFVFSVATSTDGVQNSIAWWQWLIRFTILPLGIVSPFATTILGILSLSEIRSSRGRLTGKILALVDALFYPILLLDGLLFGLIYITISNMTGAGLGATELIALMGYLLILIVDIVIFLIAWNKIR